MTGKHIAFIDTNSGEWDCQNIYSKELGATEQVAARQASALKESLGYKITFIQRLRKNNITLDGISYVNYEYALSNKLEPDFVILLKSLWLEDINFARQAFPRAKLIFWNKMDLDYIQKNYKDYGKFLNRIDCFVHNSRHTLNEISRYIPHFRPSTFIYNSVIDHQATGESRDYNKLLYASAPTKGLRKTFNIFQKLNATMPRLKLSACAPYGEIKDFGHNFKNLGKLDISGVYSQLASSLWLVFSTRATRGVCGGILWSHICRLHAMRDTNYHQRSWRGSRNRGKI